MPALSACLLHGTIASMNENRSMNGPFNHTSSIDRMLSFYGSYSTTNMNEGGYIFYRGHKGWAQSARLIGAYDRSLDSINICGMGWGVRGLEISNESSASSTSDTSQSL